MVHGYYIQYYHVVSHNFLWFFLTLEFCERRIRTAGLSIFFWVDSESSLFLSNISKHLLLKLQETVPAQQPFLFGSYADRKIQVFERQAHISFQFFPHSSLSRFMTFFTLAKYLSTTYLHIISCIDLTGLKCSVVCIFAWKQSQSFSWGLLFWLLMGAN